MTPRYVPNKPVEFPSTRSYLVDFTDVAQWSSALKTKAWELTRDKVGATAELSAVIEENGHSHPFSVKSYFCCRVCLQRYDVSWQRPHISNWDDEFIHFVFSFLVVVFLLFFFQVSFVQLSAVDCVVHMHLTHYFSQWLITIVNIGSRKKLPSSPCVIRPCFPSPPDDWSRPIRPKDNHLLSTDIDTHEHTGCCLGCAALISYGRVFTEGVPLRSPSSSHRAIVVSYLLVHSD